MLGVASVVPLLTTHTDVPRAAVRDGGRLDRWRRIAAGSAGQCGRAVVPDLGPAVAFKDALAADTSDLRLVLGEPSVPEARLRFDTALTQDIAGAASVFVAVGPEGGWSPEELRLADASGCRVVGLGERTLRADAAPLVALSVLLFASGDL
jgi:16S rRNA (uracil1498-N3)-methyltransferase